MSLIRSYLPANEKYAASPPPPAQGPGKRLVVVTCMDPRLDPNVLLGHPEDTPVIIRNGGGIAKDALRSILIAEQAGGTREIAVIHHTECRMLGINTPSLQQRLKEQCGGPAAPAAVAAEIDALHFHEFADVETSVRDDVAWLKAHPLVHQETVVTGWVYDLKTRKLTEVV